ncbi:unnamed protein product [Kuraishia capsulata CBS 1993]|uniref:DNA replication complex GINS protein PSF2 n=1 Tax=Kuraishia capsulata CBS 1993 TaxID=1382522 RepID=W6MQS6_9ASCO|nr:uncharacterized protein KUCA_T00003591001 [Kuraishia capsulata CBS 1993]CDK27612.1 unnamed protein product [Kuraishia capsulata CBS 1993]
MSIPAKLTQTLTPGEVNFLAENEMITILPRYSLDKLQLIGTRIPALRPMKREQVPIWLAIILKNQDKCNIVMPQWLTVRQLKAFYDQEVKNSDRFAQLPWHWIEISKALLEKASDDMPDKPHEIRTIIQDLREIRQLKARKGLKELNESYIQLDNLSLLEINELRPFIVKVMDQMRKLSDSVNSGEQ